MRDDDRPIFVVGYQRSGTTLLQALLGAHPRIAAPPETHFVFRIADLADYFGDLEDDHALRRALHEAIAAPLGLLDGCGFDEDHLFDELRHGQRSYARILDVMLRDFAARHGKARWSEKTPTQPARAVLALFPDAQVVHIVRDPRDVVVSSMEAPWNPMGPAAVARSWRVFTLDNIRVGADAGPSRFLQVRYEDLTREPEAALRIVCAFLGEAFAPEMLSDPARRAATIAPTAAPWQARALEPVGPSRSGRWRHALSPVARARVAAIVAPLLPALGYEPARPRAVAAGRIANVLATPGRVRGALERAAIVRRSRTPAGRYGEVQRYLARVGGPVAAVVETGDRPGPRSE